MKNLFNSKISELATALDELTDKIDTTDKIYSLMLNMRSVFDVMDKFDDNDTIWYRELVTEIDSILRKGDISGLTSLSLNDLDNARNRIRQFGKAHVPVKFKRTVKYIPRLIKGDILYEKYSELPYAGLICSKIEDIGYFLQVIHLWCVHKCMTFEEPKIEEDHE
jgi:hypothetical protein|nr:MAG TPA: hypothetical protein [Caudoviricetes sp.]